VKFLTVNYFIRTQHSYIPRKFLRTINRFTSTC